MIPAFLTDEIFQDKLLKILSQDPLSLKQCASHLKANDFKAVEVLRKYFGSDDAYVMNLSVKEENKNE